MKLKSFFILIVLMTHILGGCSFQNSNSSKKLSAPSPVATFSFSVLKIGQADAIMMKTENHCVIIDCGEEDDGDEIVRYLNNNNITSVDYLIITHFDKDHVGGAADVINSTVIDNIIAPDYEGANNEYESYKEAVNQKNIVPVALNESLSFILDDVLFEIYPPQRKSYAEGDNDFSLAVSVTHGENSFLFTGDAEETRLLEIISQADSKYDFLKVAHHGKYNKMTDSFIKKIKPAYAVITCSNKNPAEDYTIDSLKNAGCSIYYTKDGNVNIKSDGYKITITQ